MAKILPFLSLLLLLLLPFASEAKILEGDWESAGAPVEPYEPRYEYAYACQAQLTDGVSRQFLKNGEMIDYELHAVAKFELNKKTKYVDSANLKWIWVVESGFEEEEVVATAPADAFSTLGHFISLHLYRGKVDRVELRATVELPLGDYVLNPIDSVRGDRNQESFRAKARGYAQRARNADPKLPDLVTRKLLVVCHKIQ